ncbi:MAG: hypothetical protein AB7U05_16810 [Mangrovibacterium sp.]
MKLFSFFEREDKHLQEDQDYIQLVSCPRNGVNCSEHRKGINQSLLLAQKCRIDKEYHKSVGEMKEAYLMAGSLSGEQCRQCSQLFQEAILNSLKQMTSELEKMTSGVFPGDRFHASYRVATSTLNELEQQHKTEV